MRRTSFAILVSFLLLSSVGFSQLDMEKGVEYKKIAAVGEDYVTASSDGTVTLWDGQVGAIKRVLFRHREEIRDLTGIGSRYVAALSYGLVLVWDLEENKISHRFFDSGNSILSIGGLDRSRMVSVSKDHKLSVWSLKSGVKQVKYRRPHPSVGSGNPTHITSMGRGIFVVLARGTGRVKLWYLYTGKIVTTLLAGSTTTGFAKLSIDRVVTTGPISKVRVWNSRTGEMLKGLYVRKEARGVAALASDRFVTVDKDGTRIWQEGVDF